MPSGARGWEDWACAAAHERTGLERCYIRPMVLRGYGAAGMLPVGSPVHVVSPCWPWGSYLGPEFSRDQILAYRRRVNELDERLPAGPASLRRAAWAVAGMAASSKA